MSRKFMPQISGKLFDKKSKLKQDVTLEVDTQGYYSLIGKSNKRWRFKNVQISPNINNSTRFLTLPDGRLFETDDNAAVDDAIRIFGAGDVNTFAQYKAFIYCMALSAVLALSWATFRYGIPAATESVAMMVPHDVLVEHGREAFKSMDANHFSDSELDEERIAALEAIFNSLLPDVEPRLPYTLHVRSGGDIGANAFALPSGDIVITDELVNLSSSDDELSAVMLHEIAHVERQHGVQSIIQFSGVVLAAVLITGDISSMTFVFAGIPALLLNSNYSRRMEWESDDYAVAELQKRNIDPIHLATLLEKLVKFHQEKRKEEGKGPIVDEASYLSTHPATNDRVEAIREESAKWQARQSLSKQVTGAGSTDR